MFAGYTLVYTKQLRKQEYILEGTAELTNPSGTDPVNIQSLTIFLGTQQISPSCGALPGGELRLGPTQHVSCPFSAAFSTGEGSHTLGSSNSSSGSSSGSSPPLGKTSFLRMPAGLAEVPAQLS
jgi:hypothetical protein